MEPIARAAYVMIAGAAVFAVFVGAIAGAFAWAVRPLIRSGPLWVGLMAGAFYLAQSFFGQIRLSSAALVGLPLLILGLMSSWLAAGLLESRWRWKRIWASLAGLPCGIVVGFLCMATARLTFWAFVPVAIVVDVILIGIAYWARKRFAA